jgi:hypothetical protein
MILTNAQYKIKGYLLGRGWRVHSSAPYCEVLEYVVSHRKARISVLAQHRGQSCYAWMIDTLNPGSLVMGDTYAEFVVAFMEYTESTI